MNKQITYKYQKLLSTRTLTINNIQELADKYITNAYRKLLNI